MTLVKPLEWSYPSKKEAAMSEQNESSREEVVEKLYSFVVQQIKEGADKSEIVQKMVDTGVSRDDATPLVDGLYAEIMKAAKEQEFAPDAVIPAVIGGVLAAIIGGAVWGVVAIATRYELGYLAWGLGFLSGFAVVFFAKGRRGLPLQLIAALSSILGIVIGKYVTFHYYLKEAAEKKYGAEVASNLSVVSDRVLQFFVQNISTMLSGFDVLWVILAVLSAWRIPKGLGVKVPTHYIP